MNEERPAKTARDDAAARKRRRVVAALAATLVVLLVAGGAALAVLRPWAQKTPARPAERSRGPRAGQRMPGPPVTGSRGTPRADQGPSREPPRTPGGRTAYRAPAGKDATLGPVAGFPPRTVAMLDASHATTGSIYEIEFRPYGFGPHGTGSRSLVIAVTASKAVRGAAMVFDFKGKSVLADTSALPAGEAVKRGGTYRGRLELKARGTFLAPTLIAVERLP